MKRKKSIIDYDELETAIVAMEEYLKRFDMEEADLILKSIIARRAKARQQQTINDNLQNVKIGSLVKNFMKKDKGED